MATQINKQKLTELLEAKQNPTLAVFRAIQEMEDKIAQMMKDCMFEMREKMKIMMKEESAHQKEIDIFGGLEPAMKLAQRVVQEEIIAFKQSINEQISTGLANLKAKKEAVSQEIMGMVNSHKDIDKKMMAEVMAKMEETHKQMKEKCETMMAEMITEMEKKEKMMINKIDSIANKVVKMKGLPGQEGKTPIRGIDYFTNEDKQEFMDKIKKSLDMEEIKNELAEIRKMLEIREKIERFGGQKTMHRGGLSLEWEAPTETNSTTLTLSAVPYADDTVLLFRNGQLQRRGATEDYTISARIITLNTALATGEVVWALFRKG